MTENNGFVSAAENPELANKALGELLQPTTEIPDIEEPETDEVELPSGYLKPNGELVTKAYVRELTGEDEEALAKAAGSTSRYLSILLERGTEKVGDDTASPSVLKELLTGDREAILLGIRRATYGNTVDYVVNCAGCGERLEVEVELHDIPVRKLPDPAKRVHEVKLRKGTAEVEFPDGYTQEAILNAEKLSIPEGNTLLLSKCVLRINGKNVRGATKPFKEMGIKDRRTLLDFIQNEQPGPQYDQLKFTHDDCGTETPLYISTGDLFR